LIKRWRALHWTTKYDIFYTIFHRRPVSIETMKSIIIVLWQNKQETFARIYTVEDILGIYKKQLASKERVLEKKKAILRQFEAI
jgi:hypothetical protein